jgi:hypothetical protein
MAEKFKAKLGLDTKEFDSGLKKSESGMSKFGKQIKGIGLAIAAAFSVRAIANFAKEAINLASKIEGVRIAFMRLGAPGLLEGLRAATRGTVTDLQLMQKAVQANNFKIPLSQLATYFEFATKRAIQTGESVDYLVDSIIAGIGRKSVLVMDNLGISAVELQNEIAKTGDFAVASGNIIKRELESMGDVADTTATQIASIGTAIKNLKTTLGTKLTETPVFQGLAKWMNNVAKFVQMPGMSLGAAIYGATFKADEFNEDIDKSNKLIAENAAVILKQKESVAAANAQAQAFAAMKKENQPPSAVGNIPSLSGLPGLDTGISNVLAPGPALPDLIDGLSEAQSALINLSSTFAGFFSDVNLGFQGMIDGVITGLKRLIMELIAKAAFLTLLSAIFPGAGVALNLGTILGGNAASVLGSGKSAVSSAVGMSSTEPLSVTGVIKGQDIYLSNQRYSSGLNGAT